ncbi:MAG: hypothetical protein ACM3SR_08490 [Ignavibacteriales bacterium]
MNKKAITQQGQKYENEKEHTRRIQKAVTGEPIDIRIKVKRTDKSLRQHYNYSHDLTTM